MDSIKQAVELARAAETCTAGSVARISPRCRRLAAALCRCRTFKEVRLSADHLEAKRIVALRHFKSEHGRYYDMLRTQVLQEMDKKSWQFLAVTSPTAGCGKTVTACNLAMSIARLPERSVLLVDLDLRKPTLQIIWASAAMAACSACWKDAHHFRPRFCRQASARTVCWCFRDRSRRALPNGWPHKRWGRCCRPSSETSDRAS